MRYFAYSFAFHDTSGKLVVVYVSFPTSNHNIDLYSYR